MKKIIAILVGIVLTIQLSSCTANKKPEVLIPETTPTPTPTITDTPKSNTPDEDKTSSTDEVDNPDTEDAEDTSKEGIPGDDTDVTVDNNNPTKSTNTPSTNLSNEKIGSWQPGTNKEHKVPSLNTKYKTLLDKYGGYFVGDTSEKVIYLTFDEGYENSFTGKILDILKENNVKAAFFVTKPYIRSNPVLVKRMVNEGHIVGNHSSTHPNMPDISDEEVKCELTDTADYFKEVTGHNMPKYFRPPEGVWSERTLYLTQSLGYKTILWSMAHKDWDPKNQPGKAASMKFVDTYYHNGAILLLHAVSQSNTEALPDIINNMQDAGYRFAPLSELK